MVKEIQNSLIETVGGMWKRRKWLLLAAFMSVFAVALSIIYSLPPLYQASTTILVGQEDIETRLITNDRENELRRQMDVVRQAMLSRNRLLEVVEQYDLYPDLREMVSDGAIVSQMRKDIGFEQETGNARLREDNAFPLTISYRTWDPQLAAEVANGLAALYKQENEKLRQEQASTTTAFLQAQLEAASERVTAKQMLIDDFKMQHLGDLPEQQNLNMANLQRLTNELNTNTQRQVQLMDMRDNLMRGRMEGGLETALAGSDPVFRLERMKLELQELSRLYTDSYPAIIRLKQEIAKLEEQMEAGTLPVVANVDETSMSGTPEDIGGQLSKLRREEQELRKAIADLQERLKFTPRLELELTRLNNDYQSAREEYESLQQRYQEARLAESLEQRDAQWFQVLETALPPNLEHAPARMRLALMSLVLSMGFAAAVVLVAEQMDSSFHSPRDLRNFTRLPILGSIYKINTRADKLRYALRALLIAVLFVISLCALVILFHNLADGAKGIVWTLAG